jgi:hypothetical protein
MLTFNPLAYPRVPQSLFAFPAPLPLDAGTPHEAARGGLAQLEESREFNEGLADAHMARCCRAALWLAHNFLDESHSFSQAVETAAGSYWHGILHRREGDFENAKYWMRAVGKQYAVFPQLHTTAKALAQTAGELDRSTAFLATQPAWNPAAFIDACAAAVRGQTSHTDLLRRVAQYEWELLFDHCYQAAFGKNG